MTNSTDYWTVVKRGLRRRCPRCGEGRVFTGYIALLAECPECRESFRNIRTDDAAPWATILFVGHFAVWLVATLINTELSSNQLTLIGVLFVLVGAAVTLPVMKGVFVNINWISGQRYAAPDDQDR